MHFVPVLLQDKYLSGSGLKIASQLTHLYMTAGDERDGCRWVATTKCSIPNPLSAALI